MKSELVEKAQVVHSPDAARQPMGIKTAALSDETWNHIHAEIGKARGNMPEDLRSKIE